MCGIAGLIDSRDRSNETALRHRARTMTDALAHRGPDGEGVFVDAAAGLALGHRRLAVVDLSPTGHQPMVSADERCVVTYNGEIYNAAELRAELAAEGRSCRGTSDTAVLLEACAAWGVERTVTRLVGMFAFALWDRRARRLSLVRDRLGIKPLYWARFDGLFLFGSEPKALRAHPGWTPTIDSAALAAYLRFGYVPAPHGIYAGVRKLPPGSVLTLEDGREPVIAPFWRPADIARDGVAARFAGGEDAAAEQLETLLRDAVRRRMIADVPLGAFLSGGIDSSTVVALMQSESARPVKTFSIGFRAAGYDEAPHARAVAAHLGTDHTEFYVEPGDALAVIPRLAEWFDEPFADSSQIPTYLVSAMTRRHVTVALSGDGGDELFAGYNRHRTARLLGRMAAVPGPLRGAAAALLAGVPPRRWDRALALLPAHLRTPQLGDKLHKLAGALRRPEPLAAYRDLVTLWRPRELGLASDEARTALDDASLLAGIDDPVERFQLLDLATYLPDDILTKVDRASMAVALEARVPLLDHRVVEFAWRLPPDLKLRGGIGKRLLRRVLARHVPPRLTSRPKSGFAVPLDSWLRGPLRGWAEALLDPARLESEAGIDPAPVRATWQRHLAGEANEQHRLWAVLMLQAWLERERSAPAAPMPKTAVPA